MLDVLKFYPTINIQKFLSRVNSEDSPIKLTHLDSRARRGVKIQLFIPSILSRSKFCKGDRQALSGFIKNSIGQTDSLNFILMEKDTNKILGFTALRTIDLGVGCAEVETYLIKDMQKHAFYYYVMKELLAVAFYCLGLEFVYCLIDSQSSKSAEELETLGFKRDRTVHHIKSNDSVTEVLMSCYIYESKWYIKAFDMDSGVSLIKTADRL